MIRGILITFLCAAILPLRVIAAEPVQVEVSRFYFPNTPEEATTSRIIDLMDEDEDLQVVQWGGLSLPGGGGRASLMMSIAGRTAPDIMESWFHVIRNDVHQGFLYPLNEWIGEDADGDGFIGDDEADWDRWSDIPELWRRVATVDGKVYGIPQITKYFMGVIYRRDTVRAAGLNPDQPPETWEDFVAWCMKLTDPQKSIPGAAVQRGQRAIALSPFGFTWLPWVEAAGGNPIIQVRESPITGESHLFPMYATEFVTDTGEDLSKVTPTWKANFASEAGMEAAELYHRLRWMKWMIDPRTGQGIELKEQDLAAGHVDVDGRRIPFNPDDVITGVARGQTGQREADDMWRMLGLQEVGMVVWFVQDMQGLADQIGIDPRLLSWFPIPRGPGEETRPVVQVQRHYAVMSEGVGRRPHEEREKVWKVLTAVTDDLAADNAIRDQVLAGLAAFVNPLDLQRLGLEDYLDDVSPVVRRNFEQIRTGEVRTTTEPFSGFWVTVDDTLNRRVLSLILAETGEDFDYRTALAQTEEEANKGLMFGHAEEELNRYRPAARVIFLIILVLVSLFAVKVIRAMMRTHTGKSGKVRAGIAPWLIMFPALILIMLWAYYPLFRGMVMAFQDYRIVGDSAFIGLDNFIALALDRSFWISMWRTVQFVILNISLAFIAPILLAVLLSEVPTHKVFFRTLFFLPNMTSGLVIALMWKMLYDPTPEGTLNRFIALVDKLPIVNIGDQTWLQDPSLAMLCTVIPTVWASMGMASLIYLAALKAVPDELYEAAEMDGAGLMTKLRKITLPTLMPLIIINLVGTFIGTFQNMGNIFLMTFGGPGDATMVIAMKIWIEAYNNLRFSMATTMAWVLGALLIGFTFVQIKLLQRVEFRKAEWD